MGSSSPAVSRTKRVIFFNDKLLIVLVLMIRAAEEERDVGQKLHPAAEDNQEERGGKRGGPRKMFRWTEEIRSDDFEILAGFCCFIDCYMCCLGV